MSDNRAGTTEASVDALMVRGAVDLHCHSGPSVMARLVDHTTPSSSRRRRMRAVLFDHYYPTAPIVELIRQRMRISAWSRSAPSCSTTPGGFNAYAVEHALKMGSKVV